MKEVVRAILLQERPLQLQLQAEKKRPKIASLNEIGFVVKFKVEN